MEREEPAGPTTENEGDERLGMCNGSPNIGNPNSYEVSYASRPKEAASLSLEGKGKKPHIKAVRNPWESSDSNFGSS